MQPFSERMKAYWSRLDGVFQAIAHGDDELGIPPYNGGLFDPAAAPILARVQLPDAVVRDIVFRLSHIDIGDGRPPKYINYRDLSVQQLGSVYERMLEHGLKVRGRPSRRRRRTRRRGKSSGSYYTPEELVALIIERAVGPLVAERVERVPDKAEALASDTPRQGRRGWPSCCRSIRRAGSSTSRSATRPWAPVTSSSASSTGLPTACSTRWPKRRRRSPSPTTSRRWPSRIEAIRAKILAEAKAHGWPIAESQLDDRHIVRRMVLKRVVYGVDKNPMAVELAKVALWLHSFTVGAPLSFLDHHLRCGDSVVGAWARPTVDRAEGARCTLQYGCHRERRAASRA